MIFTSFEVRQEQQKENLYEKIVQLLEVLKGAMTLLLFAYSTWYVSVRDWNLWLKFYCIMENAARLYRKKT